MLSTRALVKCQAFATDRYSLSRNNLSGTSSIQKQKADNRSEKALIKLLNGQIYLVCEAANVNNVSHLTLLRRMNGKKSMAES